jgi:hypothetical protein
VFDDSARLTEQMKVNAGKQTLFRRLFSVFYRNYTREQELLTRNLKLLVENVRMLYGENIPAEIRREYRDFSRPLQKYCNMLTLNSRFYFVYLAVFLNNIWIFLLYEIIVLNIVLAWLIATHESNCREINLKIGDQKA